MNFKEKFSEYLVGKKDNFSIKRNNFKTNYLTWPPKLNLREKLQRFAGGMMTAVIFLIIVGFFVGIGTGFSSLTDRGSFMNTVWNAFNTIGFKIMGYLPLWFCLGLAFALARNEKGWAAITSLFVFFAMGGLLGLYGTVAGVIPKDLGSQVLWYKFAGLTTYNMGIFSGMIIGIWTAFVHNRSYKKQLPTVFSFFSGPRYVIVKMAFYVIPFAAVVYYAWPPINDGLVGVGNGITTTGLLGTFLFGTADKALLPIGIHHLIAFPIEYTKAGGEQWVYGLPKDFSPEHWDVKTHGVNVAGVRNIILAQSASLPKYAVEGYPAATGYITHNFTSGRILFQLGGYPGVALALIMTAKKDKRKQVMSVAIPAALTAAFVGVSEPIEYTFLFVQPLLYFFIHVPLAGLAYVLAEVTKVSINGHAIFFMLGNITQPGKVHAMSLLYLIPGYFIVYFLSFYYSIKIFNIQTPGRTTSGEEVKLFTKADYLDKKDEKNIIDNDNAETILENKIIEAFGGKDNIESVNNCATRLRVSVINEALVSDKEHWVKELNAIAVIQKDRSFQIIYGPKVMVIATKIRETLEIK